MSSFCHLNICSDFSLQESTITVSKLIDFAVKNKQPAIALTDVSNLFGAVEFYSKCMAKGIKPILGCTFYICDNHKDKSSEKYKRFTKYPQITLLAKNNEGWKNLMKLSSASYLDGFYYLPRIDKDLLSNCSNGLIALSSSNFGDISELLKNGEKEDAKKLYQFYDKVFKDDFFLEVHSHDNEIQKDLNNKIILFANDNNANIVATNPSRFLNEDDFDSFKAVMALKSKRTVHDEVVGDFNESFFLKDNDSVVDYFKDCPEAISNTLYIASKCNVDMKFGVYQMPDFELPEGTDIYQHLYKICHDGLENKWKRIELNNPNANKKDYLKRLNHEIETLAEMGFLGYFLVVSDFIQWAKDNDIPVGPGRGSGAGSLVAYSMEITDLDPIRYGLLFERFLNSERVSMPDFDIDFCRDKRENVIRYVEEKYGKDKVSQIINFGKMKAKAAIKDVGRVFDVPYEKVDKLSKLIPKDLDITLTNALEREPRLEEFIQEDDEVAKIYEEALKLEGNNRHAGKHAAGVVIGKHNLVESAPLYKVPGEEGTVVQWDMKSAEKSGLIKFDFLGLKTLTVIDKAVKTIQKDKSDFDINFIPMDDIKTFELLQSGKTSSVFQLESDGMQGVLKDLSPDCFEDIIALVALYRPGPLESGMVSSFIKRKHGMESVEYPHPLLEKVLEETYGVIIYQEQVMEIARVLSGYTLGGADILRRAMGKKDPVEMEKQRSVFVDGAINNKIDGKVAGDIFDLIQMFAGYGFNKSHSAAYALICYQTAYLKANYPHAFMSASMTCDSNDDSKLRTFVYDTRLMDIDVLYPDINTSEFEFSTHGENILTGLCSLKGLGEKGAKTIVKERKISPFSSIDDFIARCDINKKGLEVLIKSGSMDSFFDNREFMIANIPTFIKKAKNINKEKESGQFSMFDTGSGSPLETYNFAKVDDIDAIKALTYEKEAFGFYLGKHPATMLHELTSNLFDYDGSNINLVDVDESFTSIATVEDIRIIRLDSGNMGILSLSDRYNHYEAVCFPRTFGNLEEILEDGKTVVLDMKKTKRNERESYIIEKAYDAKKYINKHQKNITVTVPKNLDIKKKVKDLNKCLKKNKNGSDVSIEVELKDSSVAILKCEEKRKISCDDALTVIDLGIGIKLKGK